MSQGRYGTKSALLGQEEGTRRANLQVLETVRGPQRLRGISNRPEKHNIMKEYKYIYIWEWKVGHYTIARRCKKENTEAMPKRGGGDGANGKNIHKRSIMTEEATYKHELIRQIIFIISTQTKMKGKHRGTQGRCFEGGQEKKRKVSRRHQCVDHSACAVYPIDLQTIT